MDIQALIYFWIITLVGGIGLVAVIFIVYAMYSIIKIRQNFALPATIKFHDDGEDSSYDLVALYRKPPESRQIHVDKSPKELAEEAYYAYAASTKGKTFSGDQMKAWADLPRAIQIAWEAAIRQALDSYEGRPGGVARWVDWEPRESSLN